jgi:hypothetical protein
MKPNINLNHRSLTEKLEAYAEHDLAFKQELIHLMISNLREFQQAFSDALSFDRVAHKVKSTLTILDDSRINSLVTELKSLLRNPKDKTSRIKAGELFELLEQVINDLNDEASISKAC